MILDGAILIQNGIIRAVGPSRQVLSLAGARDCRELDATGKVVMPAFVDAAASLVQARPHPRSIARLSRLYNHADSEVFQEVLNEGAQACTSLSSQTLKHRANRTAAGMLQHGTGTVQSHAPYALDETTATKVLRIQREYDGALETVSSLLLKVPPAGEPTTWAEAVCEQFLPRVWKRRLASSVALEFDGRFLPAALAKKILRAAAQTGFSLSVHADPCGNTSAVSLAIEAGVTSTGGFRNITFEEIQGLAASSTIAVFRPGLEFQTGMRFERPGRAMLDAGVIPGLASAFHAELSPAYSMQMILLLASRCYRFSAEEAISAATINNAYALRREALVGSLETGKQGDVIVLNVSDYRELGYYAGINVVDKVFKRGMLVYDATPEYTTPRLDPTRVSHMH